MEYHRGGAPEPHFADVRKEREPRQIAEVLPDKEVAVSSYEVLTGAAQVLQLPGDALREIRPLVIPDPGLEEVPEDVELVAPQALLAEEPDEPLGNVGSAVLEMEIPDEYAPHLLVCPNACYLRALFPYSFNSECCAAFLSQLPWRL